MPTMNPSVRVVLVALDWTRDQDPRPPLGHASLLAALVEANITVRSLCFPVNAPSFSCDAVVQKILAAVAPDGDVAIGAYVWGEQALQIILPRLRAAGFVGRIILGGPQISYAGAGVEVLYREVDVFIRGYGEQALVEVARSPGVVVEGAHYRGQPDRCQQAKVTLEALPSPWLAGLIAPEPGGLVRMETQRGCPFRCSFCQHREAGARLRRRNLAADRVTKELEHFVRIGVTRIAVLDPIFNAGPKAAAYLLHLRALGFRGQISLQCRFEMLDETFLDACEGLDVQLEFGLQTIHAVEGKEIERKNQIHKVEAAIAALHRRGIHFEVSLIFGLPMQTLRSFEQSVDFCLSHGVPVIKAFPLMLLRGTKLEQDRARWGLQESGGKMSHVIASDTFSAEDWREMARLSEALKATEGAHPPTVAALWSHTRTPDLCRWAPRAVA
ncbi:MAG: radical SAM superfamily enzyme YgiQ (UPF0313 family) [Myxococcota bacterium]|jgi:radical SAM superfamily enzyme YgiQ (UPF0313 family)